MDGGNGGFDTCMAIAPELKLQRIFFQNYDLEPGARTLPEHVFGTSDFVSSSAHATTYSIYAHICAPGNNTTDLAHELQEMQASQELGTFDK